MMISFWLLGAAINAAILFKYGSNAPVVDNE